MKEDHYLDKLKETVSRYPDRKAIQIVNSKCAIKESVTFKQLWEQTGILATHLLKEGIKKGDRVMIIYPNTAQSEYLLAFLACFRVGIIPVSIYPPNPQKIDQDLIKFDHFVASSGATRAITTAEYKRFVQISSLTKKWAVPAKHWMATDTLIKKKVQVNEDEVFVKASDENLVFIQYTSGSTGDPKGVPIHYRSFMTSILYGQSEFDITHKKYPLIRVFVWVPVYHDYGLLNRLMTIYGGQELYVMDPITFIQQPLVWPESCAKYDINITMGPNFSYALVTRKCREQNKTFNLSKLTVANLSAEPIVKSTLDDMQIILGVPKEAISICYGFAEACVWVSTVPGIIDEETLAVASGDLDRSLGLDMDFVIADKETGVILPDGVTGDIFVQGRGLVKQYWNNPEASKDFEYTIQGREGKWYFSGDLGYVKNRILFCTGRSKDVIIVNGKNIYATDLERRVEETFPEILRPGCSAAFQVSDDEAVVVCEFKPGQESNLEADRLIIMKKELEEEFGLKIKDIVCASKGSVPKTTSGKIRRSETKKQYLAGNIKSSLHLSEKVVCDTFEQLLKHYDVQDFEKTLVENGIDSLKLSRLMEESKSQFGLTIDFMMSQEIPCSDLETVCQQKSRQSRPKPAIPSYPLQGTTMPAYTLVQAILVVLLLAIVSFCTVPSAYLYRYLTSNEFLASNPQVLEPWIMTFSRGPGFLLILIPVLWMVSFTFIVVAMKWTLIGRYKPGRYEIWSLQFAKWWLMDRMLDLWEMFIGCYFIDTPFLNVLYIILGVDCDVSVRFKTFVREFDLVHCGSYSVIKGTVLARLVDTEGLLLDRIYIDKNVVLESRTCTYPGTKFIAADLKRNDHESAFSISTESPGIWEQIQRTTFPLNFMLLMAGCNYFASWMTSHYKSSSFEWEAARVFISFFISMFLVMILTGMLVQLRIFDYTADRLFSICEGFLGYWFDMSPFINLFHITLFSGKISILTQANAFSFISPSESRFVEAKAGSAFATGFLSATKEAPIKIGENSSIGLFATINPGVTIEPGSQVSTCAVVPKDYTVKSNQSFFSTKFITKSKPRDKNGLFYWRLSIPIMAKILIQWTSGIFLIGGTIVAMKQIQDRIMLELWLQVPVITVLTLLVSGFGFILFDILISRLIVPTVRKESRKIVYGSVWSSCCSMQISFHYQVEAFAGSFLRGSVFMTIYYMLLGLKVDHPSKVLFFGQLHDMKNLRISRGSDDIEQGKVVKPFHFVADKRSFFEGHRLEHGTLVFEKVQAIGTVSLHPQAIVMDQTLVDVTIGKQTRVMFTKNVTKNTTGFYYGMPSEECSEPDQNETILQ